MIVHNNFIQLNFNFFSNSLFLLNLKNKLLIIFISKKYIFIRFYNKVLQKHNWIANPN